MRLAQKQSQGSMPKLKSEPLAEGMDGGRKPRGFYSKMGDEEIIAYAMKFCTEKGIRSREKLKKANSGLYFVLRKRKLLDDIRLLDSNGGRRDWAGMERFGLVATAKKFIAEKGIAGREELKKADPGLYWVLYKRKLMDGIGLVKKRRGWAGMREEELIAHAKRLIAEKGIVSRMGLAKADSGLYYALRGRELLDEAGLEEGIRYWAGMGRDELVAHAKRFIAERGIIGRSELEKADSGLYRALRKRKLLGEIGLEEKLRYWAGMENDELVAHAKRFIAERGIIGRRELEKADSGLYQALRKRKLLGEIGLKKKSRDWAMMKRDELVAHANRFIAEKGIAGRGELKEADSGLYFVLSKRKLLDEMGLQDSNSEHRDWAGMGREELVAHAKEFIEKKCVRGRAELERADKGLYLVLLKMRLLDAVFSGIESEKRKEAVMGVIDTLESFGDGE